MKKVFKVFAPFLSVSVFFQAHPLPRVVCLSLRCDPQALQARFLQGNFALPQVDFSQLLGMFLQFFRNNDLQHHKNFFSCIFTIGQSLQILSTRDWPCLAAQIENHPPYAKYLPCYPSTLDSPRFSPPQSLPPTSPSEIMPYTKMNLQPRTRQRCTLPNRYSSLPHFASASLT